MNLAKSHLGEEDPGSAGDDLSDIVIRGYSPIGAINGIGFGSAQVESREGLIPGRQIATQSVRIELSTGGDYPQVGSASVSYENVDRLLSAISRMQFTNIDTTRFKFTEVEYEIDGFKIIVFNNDRGSLMFALSADSVSVHFNSIAKLGDIKTLIERAKSHLEETRISG